MTADTALDDIPARAREMEALAQVSERFGRSLSGALDGAKASGRGLDDLLGSIGSRLAAATTSTIGSSLTNALQDAGRSLSASLNLDSFGGALPFAKGGAFANGAVQAFAAGGVVASPTYFPLAGGTGAGLGLMGEAGPEAVMPLARGPDGRLGVRAGSAQPAAPTIHVTVQASDLDSFKRSETQIAAALARAVARGRRAT